jgi:phosphoribosylformylglycinamidine synthase
MKFVAHIDIMPLKELLDPQGKAVGKNMLNIGINGIDDVRIGKHIQITLEANNQAEAESKIEESCKKILANQIMEGYKFSVTPL